MKLQHEESFPVPDTLDSELSCNLMDMDDTTMLARRQKSRHFFAQRHDYCIFVGIPLAQPRGWDQVLALEMDTLVAANLRAYRIEDVCSWVVAYPDTGEIVDAENLFAPLPVGVCSIKSETLPLPKFTSNDLERGGTSVKIQHGRSPTHPKNSAYYSTSLTNISSRKMRCNSFGFYRNTKEGFKLFTVTGTLFSANQFEEWYGVRRGGWIESGETVSDPSNYGRGCVWVYHCETDQNIEFHVGAKCPSAGFLRQLLALFGRKLAK
jgi:hypothetical protein